MTQLLTPAQILLVLWLLAAAAPAATVLMNGSLLPIASACTSEPRTAKEEEERLEEELSNEQAIDGAVLWLGANWLCGEYGSPRSNDNEAIWARVDVAEGPRPLPGTSVLSSAVQRHRPKLA